MSERTPYQEGIIKRYYNRRDDIMLARLGDLVSDLYLTEEVAKLDRLWGRVAKAMQALGVPQPLATQIVARRDADQLARHVRTWMADSKCKGKRTVD